MSTDSDAIEAVLNCTDDELVLLFRVYLALGWPTSPSGEVEDALGRRILIMLEALQEQLKQVDLQRRELLERWAEVGEKAHTLIVATKDVQVSKEVFELVRSIIFDMKPLDTETFNKLRAMIPATWWTPIAKDKE